MRRTIVTLLLWGAPLYVHAHGEPPLRFLAPRGADTIVLLGQPYAVEWIDPDLFPDTKISLFVRQAPIPPYLHDWPTEAIEGIRLAGPVSMEDAANAFSIDTYALGPGAHFFYFVVGPSLGPLKYVAPEGVLRIVEDGAPVAPAIWIEEPAIPLASLEGDVMLRYSTSPAEGVTVRFLLSRNDLEGEHLREVLRDQPGGSARLKKLDLRCEEDGVFNVFGEVTDEAGAKGAAFATGRISWRRPAGIERPEACPEPEPEEPPKPEDLEEPAPSIAEPPYAPPARARATPADAGGCSAGAAGREGIGGVFALLLLLRRRAKD